MSGSSRIRSFFAAYGLYLAWVVALIATGGSLYLSEVIGFLPCKLCWLQRIFMYPLVLLLGRAAYKGDRGMIGYALPLAVIGGCFSLYHYAEQQIPGMAGILPCSGGVSCSQDDLDRLGFITIPFLALVAFALIAVSLWLGREADGDERAQAPA